MIIRTDNVKENGVSIGMFSRYGKVTGILHSVFREKKHIVKPKPSMDNDIFVRFISQDNQKGKDQKNEGDNKVKENFIFKTVDREKAQVKRDKTPDAGKYAPKHDLTEPRVVYYPVVKEKQNRPLASESKIPNCKMSVKEITKEINNLRIEINSIDIDVEELKKYHLITEDIYELFKSPSIKLKKHNHRADELVEKYQELLNQITDIEYLKENLAKIVLGLRYEMDRTGFNTREIKQLYNKYTPEDISKLFLRPIVKIENKQRCEEEEQEEEEDEGQEDNLDKILAENYSITEACQEIVSKIGKTEELNYFLSRIKKVVELFKGYIEFKNRLKQFKIGQELINKITTYANLKEELKQMTEGFKKTDRWSRIPAKTRPSTPSPIPLGLQLPRPPMVKVSSSPDDSLINMSGISEEKQMNKTFCNDKFRHTVSIGKYSKRKSFNNNKDSSLVFYTYDKWKITKANGCKIIPEFRKLLPRKELDLTTKESSADYADLGESFSHIAKRIDYSFEMKKRAERKFSFPKQSVPSTNRNSSVPKSSYTFYSGNKTHDTSYINNQMNNSFL